MKKRMLACLLVLCMVMTMAPTVAFAADADLTQTVEQQDVDGLPAGDGSDSNDGNDVESEGQTGLTEEESQKDEAPAEGVLTEDVPNDEEESEIELLAEPEEAAEYVAQIGDTGYTTLSAAIEAVNNDDATVVLKKSVDLSGNLAVNNGHSFTLDLADNTLTLARMNIKSAFVTVKNGTIKGDVTLTASSEDKEYNSFTLASDAKIEAREYGIIVFQDKPGADNYGTTVNVNGTISGNADSSLWVLGNIKTDLEMAEHPVKVNVGSTAVMENKNAESTSLQMAGACIVTIEDGARITGGTAVEVRAGTLIVNGGEFIATGTPTANPNGSGTSTSGAAIAVVQHTTNLPIVVEIKNATLKGANAIFENEVQSVAGDREPITIMVDSAKLEGNAKFDVSKTEIKKTEINGNLSNEGRGSVTVSDGSTVTGSVSNTGKDDEQGDMLIQDSTVETEVTDTNVMIENSTVNGKPVDNNFGDNVARIGGKTYKTVADAIAAVKSGETITLVKDVPNASGIAVESGKEFTLDFAGHEYVLVDNGAGSPGTQTNGFQLLKDSTIVFKNGTIRIAEGTKTIARMIQNYANLTLENMTFYAENQVGSEAYPLTFNNGKILFTGNTSIITTKDTTPAFDVCKFGEGDYYPGVEVTFDKDFTGTINGKIVYDAKDASTHTLTIEPNQGTLGEIVVAATGSSEAAKTAINVKGGNFTAPVNPEYLDASVKAELKHGNGKLYSYYPSVEEAVADMKDGDTVTDLNADPDGEAVKSYTITLDAGKGETEWKSKTVPSGAKLELPDASRSGYRFRGWEDENGKFVGYAGDMYTVEKDMTLIAQWKKKSSGGSSSGSSSSDDKFDIDKPSKVENGSISISDKRAEKGDTVTITVKPDKGYVLDELTVFDEDGDEIKLTEKSENKFTFKMPASDVEIEVSFKAEGAEWKNPFTDVSKNDYFYDAVEWAVKKEITSGITADLFAPHMACSRAQMVTFLWRAAGSPAVQNAVNPFADVAADAYYHDAVLWAVEQGITSGVSATSFAPDAAVTRGQTVTFLYRAAGKPAVSGTNAFADVAADAFYADAVQWAVSEGVTSGTSQTSFAPNDACTRGQIVTFLYRAK